MDTLLNADIISVAVKAAESQKAEKIVAIDVSTVVVLTDTFFIASANNERQVNSVAESIEEALISINRKPLRTEGRGGGRWVLLDYGDIVFHVQHVDERIFYDLENLWKDCDIVNFS